MRRVLLFSYQLWIERTSHLELHQKYLGINRIVITYVSKSCPHTYAIFFRRIPEDTNFCADSF